MKKGAASYFLFIVSFT